MTDKNENGSSLNSQKKNYNILMILLDGVRADQVKKLESLSEINKAGTFFPKMVTASPYTLASLHSVFTGMYGSKNGVDGYYKLDKLREDCKTLTEYLSDAGYYTLGDQVKLTILPKRGFHDYIAYNDEEKLEYKGEHSDLVDRHISILDDLRNGKARNKPFFAFLDCGIMHTGAVKEIFKKYDDFSENYFSNFVKNKHTYEKRLKIVDSYICKIWDYFKHSDLEKDTILIFFSDHGMSFGEKKGERAYGVYTFDYTIRVFSTFVFPRLFPRGLVVDEITETIDLMPTILECLQINEDRKFVNMTGKSLLDSISRSNSFWSRFFSKSKSFSYTETGGLGGPWPSPHEPNVKCIRTKKWKLIHNSTPDTWELYNISQDPNEDNNLSEKNLKILKSMKSQLEQIEQNNKI